MRSFIPQSSGFRRDGIHAVRRLITIPISKLPLASCGANHNLSSIGYDASYPINSYPYAKNNSKKVYFRFMPLTVSQLLDNQFAKALASKVSTHPSKGLQNVLPNGNPFIPYLLYTAYRPTCICSPCPVTTGYQRNDPVRVADVRG